MRYKKRRESGGKGEGKGTERGMIKEGSTGEKGKGEEGCDRSKIGKSKWERERAESGKRRRGGKWERRGEEGNAKNGWMCGK